MIGRQNPPDENGHWLFERNSSGGGYDTYFIWIEGDKVTLIEKGGDHLEWQRVRHRFTRWVKLNCELLIDGDIDARLKRLAQQEALLRFVDQVQAACKQIKKDIKAVYSETT